MERWRKPVIPANVELGTTITDAGRQDAKITFTRDQFERLCAGHICVICLEPLETAFPKNCSNPYCPWPGGFPVRDKQLEILHQRFKGSEFLGSKKILDHLEGRGEELPATAPLVHLPPGVRRA